jgi:hypothetical protein
MGIIPVSFTNGTLPVPAGNPRNSHLFLHAILHMIDQE